MKKGFTLIELLVVIAIIAVLAAVVAPNAFKAIEKGRDSAGLTDYKSIKTACHALYGDTTSWPADGSTGAELLRTTGAATWDGPYLDSWPAANPWAGTYNIQNDSALNWDGAAGGDSAVYLNATGVDATEFGRVDQKIDNSDGASAGAIQYTAASSTMHMIIALQ